MTATDPLFQLASEKDREAVEVLDATIGRLQRETHLLQSILALKGAAGWEEYVKAIKAYRESFAQQALDLKQERREYWSGAVHGTSFLLKLISDTQADFDKRSKVLRELIEQREKSVRDGRVAPGDPWLAEQR
jgi:hypothetical protein